MYLSKNFWYLALLNEGKLTAWEKLVCVAVGSRSDNGVFDMTEDSLSKICREHEIENDQLQNLLDALTKKGWLKHSDAQTNLLLLAIPEA